MNLAGILALYCPGCALAAGRAMISLGGLMLLLGLRVDMLGARVARVFGRAGIEQTVDVLATWPWWLRLLVPESPGGYVVALLWIGLGLWLIRAAAWARQFR